MTEKQFELSLVSHRFLEMSVRRGSTAAPGGEVAVELTTSGRIDSESKKLVLDLVLNIVSVSSGSTAAESDPSVALKAIIRGTFDIIGEIPEDADGTQIDKVAAPFLFPLLVSQTKQSASLVGITSLPLPATFERMTDDPETVATPLLQPAGTPHTIDT